ncbi:MAG: DUF4255 domain-containing protein [Betaproteobacteria bacterium]|nr:DUF4255 domain-containing protein [Betaproteobacteria bacterium]
MSSALAIAAVTATLKDILNDGLLNHDLSSVGSFTVTASPPDRITTGNTEPNQLNLFLYQVTANLGWRNVDLPSRNGRGDRLTNQPLALDLHYMLSAYGSEDFNAEILLGYAMQLLHENPVLTRDQIRASLAAPAPVGGSVLPPAFGSLQALDLADQVEAIKISPVFLSTEDLSKMWTAMQARYRPTMAYLVSVVLIQSANATQAAPPVLKRGKDDSGPSAVASPAPELIRARAAASDLLPSIRLGDDVLLIGAGLNTSATLTAVFENQRAGLVQQLPAASASLPAGLTAHIPNAAQNADAVNLWAAGLYSVQLRVTQPNVPTWMSNAVAVALSPSITVSPLAAAAGATITLQCSPRILPAQEATTTVIFGSQAVPVKSIATPVNPQLPTVVTFDVPAVAPGSYVVRLRVDGVQSLPIAITGTTLDFDVNQQVQVA